MDTLNLLGLWAPQTYFDALWNFVLNWGFVIYHFQLGEYKGCKEYMEKL